MLSSCQRKQLVDHCADGHSPCYDKKLSNELQDTVGPQQIQTSQRVLHDEHGIPTSSTTALNSPSAIVSDQLLTLEAAKITPVLLWLCCVLLKYIIITIVGNVPKIAPWHPFVNLGRCPRYLFITHST